MEAGFWQSAHDGRRKITISIEVTKSNPKVGDIESITYSRTSIQHEFGRSTD